MLLIKVRSTRTAGEIHLTEVSGSLGKSQSMSGRCFYGAPRVDLKAARRACRYRSRYLHSANIRSIRHSTREEGRPWCSSHTWIRVSIFIPHIYV